MIISLSWTIECFEIYFSMILSSVQFSCSVMSNSLQPHGLHHIRLPCPSPTLKACSNSFPLSQWWHPTISSSAISFSSCLQSFSASGSFQMSQLFYMRWPKYWSFRISPSEFGLIPSESVLPMNIQDWFPLQLTDLIFWQPKGLSRVFSNTTFQKHQFLGTQHSL